MKVSQIAVTNFKGKIIDSHVHSGQWKDKLAGENVLRDYTPDIAIFTKEPLKNGDTVEKVIVSNLGSAPISIWLMDIKKNVWSQSLFAPQNKI